MEFKQHATQIVENYKANPKITSILISGSVSRGWNDAYSDIEIYVLWKEPPTDEDRLSPIDQAGGKVMDFYPFEENEWSETFIAGGVKFEMSHFLVSYLDEMIGTVIRDLDTDKDKQCLMAGIQDGIILYGETAAQTLKNKVTPYPDMLGKQVILENMTFSSRWNNRYGLMKRDDFYILYDVFNEAIGKLLEILHGLNQMYIAHPRLKWVKQTVAQMNRAPKNLVERLKNIYKEPNEAGIEDLENMFLEVCDLIEETYPELDVKGFKDSVLGTRPTEI